MSAPSITYTDLTYTITLFREGKSVVSTFGEHSLSICAARENELSAFERNKIKGPAAADGNLYYIYARHYDIALPNFVWLESKEEAVALKDMLSELEAGQEDGEYSAFAAR
jgi:hypothetical protein